MIYDDRSARRLIDEHYNRLRRLKAASDFTKQHRAAARQAAAGLAQRAAAVMLRDVPIEEINRDKLGIRTKLLRDSGLESVADLIGISPQRLSAIRGIGEDGARMIVHIARDMASEAAASARIRLSLDDRSRESALLMRELYALINGREYTDDCRELYAKNADDVTDAVDSLSKGLGFFRRLFTPSQVKREAELAYRTLQELSGGDYGRAADHFCDRLDALTRADENTVRNDFARNSVRYIAELEKTVPEYVASDDGLYGLPEVLAREVQEQPFLPEGLKCQLRPYQVMGTKYILKKGRVLLGDEMGLGKTVQAIAAMVSLRNGGASHFLVVCPASVMTNWVREIARHSDIPSTEMHGWDRNDEVKLWNERGGAGVTTYETLGALNIPEDLKIDLMVVDEAHYIKNPSTKRTKAVRAYSDRVDRVLFMTGTALENRVEEMVRLIGMLQGDVARSVQDKLFMSRAKEFRDAIAPVYYRRKREEVMTELPEKIESEEWLSLGEKEKKAYRESVLSENIMAARRVSWNAEDIADSCKAERLKELVEEAADDGRKVIVFSFFLKTLEKVRELLGDRCVEEINGSVSPENRQRIIDSFDAAPAGAVLPAQITAGGTGVNIQSASVVILCEPQIKPSIENQAISRAYRMGQSRNVLVYRLLCEDTIDERLTQMLREKQEQFDAFADESTAAKRDMEQEVSQTQLKQIMEAEKQKLLAE